MGFALWIDGEMAWAQGRHEYRPMGVAVVARSDLFSPRDFQSARRTPSAGAACYVGMFASLGEVNAWLTRLRGSVRSQPFRKDLP
jgi:hypothetical protein